jgi:acyl carrier protein
MWRFLSKRRKRITTFERVRKIVADQLEIEEGEITPSSILRATFSMDDLDVIEIILAVEQAMSIEIPDEEEEAIVTVGDLVKFADQHLIDKTVKEIKPGWKTLSISSALDGSRLVKIEPEEPLSSSAGPKILVISEDGKVVGEQG